MPFNDETSRGGVFHPPAPTFLLVVKIKAEFLTLYLNLSIYIYFNSNVHRALIVFHLLYLYFGVCCSNEHTKETIYINIRRTDIASENRIGKYFQIDRKQTVRYTQKETEEKFASILRVYRQTSRDSIYILFFDDDDDDDQDEMHLSKSSLEVNEKAAIDIVCRLIQFIF